MDGLNGVAASVLGLVLADAADVLSGSLAAFFGSGSKNMVTPGSVRSSFSLISIGMLQLQPKMTKTLSTPLSGANYSMQTEFLQTCFVDFLDFNLLKLGTHSNDALNRYYSIPQIEYSIFNEMPIVSLYFWMSASSTDLTRYLLLVQRISIFVHILHALLHAYFIHGTHPTSTVRTLTVDF